MIFINPVERGYGNGGPLENANNAFPNGPWKTLRVSHIPTASTAIINQEKRYLCLRTLVTHVSRPNTWPGVHYVRKKGQSL